jgi:N-acetylglucosaminyldiphosphoundecaprenol N-acetyl-beta-D-mannosaminyltransferase
LFGVEIHAINMQQAVATLLRWIHDDETQCRYVVTPNVDHVVQLQEHAGLRAAYRDANLILADGWPVVLASRLLGRPLPERVPGSDLVPALFASGERLRVFLLGAEPGVAEVAAERIQTQWPSVKVVGCYSPPRGFDTHPVGTRRALQLLEETPHDVLVLGLGAPKQELWMHWNRCQIPSKVALCVGATIDFLAGHRRRAPRWMQRLGLEWLHRMLSEPRRLVKRYARDAWIFPRVVCRSWLQ